MGDPIAWERLELSNLQNVAQQVRYVAEKFRQLCDELDPADKAGSVLGHAATEEAAMALCAQHASILRRMDAMRRFYEINITAEESFFFERERLKLQRLTQRVKKSASLSYMVEEDAAAPLRSNREANGAQRPSEGTEDAGGAGSGSEGFQNVHTALPDSAQRVPSLNPQSRQSPAAPARESGSGSPGSAISPISDGAGGGEGRAQKAQGFRFRLVLTPEEYDEYLSRKAAMARGNWVNGQAHA